MADLAELIAQTQELLQPLISRPKLSEKLLGKPPFRFLHDIFTNLKASNGFGEGLYNDEELQSGKIKDKNSKITYLEKMIQCVSLTLNEEIDVRSAKIVSGLEAENTNIFLQALARAATNPDLDSKRAIEKVLETIPPAVGNGEGGEDAPAAPSGSKPNSAASNASAEAKGTTEDDEAQKERERAKHEAKEKEREEIARQKEIKKRERRAREKAEAAAREKEEEEKRKEVEKEDNSNVENESKDSSRPPTRSTRGDSNQKTNSNQSLIDECDGSIEKTKELMEDVISKPRMASKLLQKPPFRFLHDVVSEVTRATGFALNLYDEEMLNSASVKDKQSKIDYLTKIIQCVGCQLNIEVDARPAKIVAGLEPENTNIFLQLLAVASRSGSSDAAVQRVLSGDIDVRPLSNSSTKSRSKAESKPSSSSSQRSDSKPTAPAKVSHNVLADDNDENEEEEREEETEAKVARPTTARRRPPKLRENVKEAGRMNLADAKVTPPSGIMKDGDNDDSDDDEKDNEDMDDQTKGNNNLDINLNEKQHGKLVRDILKAENESKADNNEENNNENEEKENETGGIRLGRRRKSLKQGDRKSHISGFSANEMKNLRMSVQKVCQAANPLGKCLEYVHEDMEAMKREMEFWKNEYEKYTQALEVETKETEDVVQPLEVEVVEVEEQIKEQVQKILSLKASIAKNENRTQKLLRMVVSA